MVHLVGMVQQWCVHQFMYSLAVMHIGGSDHVPSSKHTIVAFPTSVVPKWQKYLTSSPTEVKNVPPIEVAFAICGGGPQSAEGKGKPRKRNIEQS